MLNDLYMKNDFNSLYAIDDILWLWMLREYDKNAVAGSQLLAKVGRDRDRG